MNRTRLRSLGVVVCFLIGAAVALVVTPAGNRQNFRAEEEERGSSDAWGAFEWWYNQRALPNELIPRGAFARAAGYLRSSLHKERPRRTNQLTDSWTSLGPVNVGGRVLAIAVNPSDPGIVWAGSASGGLWKSTTGGEGANPWVYVNTGYPSLSISAIAIDSSNPNVMYIGTGEISLYRRPLIGVVGARSSYGLGILKSTDGGASWDTTGLTYSFPQVTAIQRIVINPKNSQTVYAATSEGVAKSTDAGATWAIVNPELMAMDLVINPVDTATLYSSHGNLNSTSNPGIYYTDDAGANWIKLGGGLPTANFGRTALSISRTNPNVIYAGVSHSTSGAIIGLYRTDNGGVNWTLVSSTNYVGSQGWYDNVVAVDPTDPDNVYCSGFDVYRSTSGGSSLQVISLGVHVDHHAIAFDPTNAQIMYFGCDGGIYKTENAGGVFYSLNTGFVTTQFYPGFACASDDSNFALGGLQDNGTLRYGGSTYWDAVYGGDGGWCAINSGNKFVLYAESQYMNLGKSTNGGSSFLGATSGLPASGSANYNFIPPYAISYSNPNVLYAGSRNVYKTTDGGSSWFAANGQSNTVGLNGTMISCIGIASTHEDTVMAGTGSGAVGGSPLFQVFASTNGGLSWTNVTGSLPNRYPTDIEFDPTDATTAYVTYSGYGTAHVFKTTNIGQSWTDISSNLPDLPHQAVIVDPEEPRSIFVGTDLGVFHSPNGGESWEDYNAGMPQAMVLDLTISRANGALRAATFGNGVYERKLSRTPAVALTSPNGGEILAGGVSATISWSEKFLSAVHLEYSTDDGANWTTIAASVPVSPDHYTWIVPQISTTQGRIRISDAASGPYADTSDAPFTILAYPDIIDGWNLLSVHLAVADPRASSVYPLATSPAYAFSGSYVQRESLANGTGYWLKFNVPQFVSYGGDSITTDTIDVKAGWNMIGSISVPVATASIVQIPPGIVTSSYFGYFLSYSTVTTIEPKCGYWVKVSSNGKLVLQSSAIAPRTALAQHNGDEDVSRLTVTDSRGRTQTLYYTDRELALERYELPPLPPPGEFDVRYASQRMLERLDRHSSGTIPVVISGASYPVRIGWNAAPGAPPAALEIDGRSRMLAGQGEATVSSPDARVKLALFSPAQPEIPTAFGLSQNYPNPFNPTTTIVYRIAATSRVSLKIFDLLGNEVATLVSETRQPGSYSTSWDASHLASGMYFSRLTATPLPAAGPSAQVFTDIKKMVLIK